MTSIDEVIARSRQPGGFSEHRTFTLARDRAIEKMREFALADPHFYILELIQSAVANGATTIDVTLGKSDVVVSYVGGFYGKRELEQLFDFLFVSHANVGQGSLRLLALGVNALMLFEPDEVIVESGDGTLEGTTRVVVGRREGVVEVGTAAFALDGTFVRGVGLKRRKMNRRSALGTVGGRAREYTAIEERCIVAPVPVIVNGEPMFGYSRQRTPELFGFSHTISFDEGDLYGTIGLASRESSAVFRLVTHGVWAQTVGHDFVERVQTGYEEPLLGGVISFGALQKTADHSGVVKDAVYDEMWHRMVPYLEQLRFGTQASRMDDILSLDGMVVTPADIIKGIREARGVVVLPGANKRTNTKLADHARRVGEALGFPVFCVTPGQDGFLRSVAGDAWPVVVVNVADPNELLVYQEPENSLPARPWLIEPIDCGTVTMDEINREIDSSRLNNVYDGVVEDLRAKGWGGQRRIRTTLYTQFDDEPRDVDGDNVWADLRVWIQVCGRLVKEVRLDAFFPGQVLVVDIPDIQPAKLLQSVQISEPCMADLIADAVASMLSIEINASVGDAIEALSVTGVVPDSLGARWIVAGLAQSAITRLSARPGQEASVSIELIDHRVNPALLDVDVLTTLTGESVSMRGLAELIQQGRGLVYGVVPGVDADLAGLDRSKILRLDLHLERLLVELLGEATYVRVDGRDVLAERWGVQCRDIALGLRDYSDFPLLVEGVDLKTWPESEQRVLIYELLRGLKDVVASTSDDFPLESRRQALRHLQWFAVNHAHYPVEMWSMDIDDEPLFLTCEELSVPYSTIRNAQGEVGDLRMFDGVARDVVGDNVLFGMTRSVVAPDTKTIDLAMNPYVFWLLNEHDTIVGLSAHGSAGGYGEGESTRYLDQVELSDGRFEGVLRIPFHENLFDFESRQKARGAVLVMSRSRLEVVALEDAFHAYGVVGVVKRHLQSKEFDRALAKAVMESARTLLIQQINRVASGRLTQGELYEQVVCYLLYYAEQHMNLSVHRDGLIRWDVIDLLANRVLDLPLFSAQQGVPLSVRRLFYVFRNVHLARPEANFDDLQWASELIALDDVPATLRAWLVAHFHPERIRRRGVRRGDPVVQPVSYDVRAASDRPLQRVEGKEQALLATIDYWLQALRPDSRVGSVVEVESGASSGTESIGIRFLAEKNLCSKLQLGVKPEPLLVQDTLAIRRVLGVGFFEDTVFLGVSFWLNLDHWIVQWALAVGQTEPDEGRSLAWLLLAIYAHVNEALEGVENVDEQIFQQRVFMALRSGELRWVV